MSRKNFIHVSFSVCTGVSIFRDIANFSFFRTFVHFVLFLLLCSFLSLALRFPSVESTVNIFLKTFSNEFGSVIIESSSFQPEIAPEKMRSIVIGPCRIDYLPENSIKTLPAISSTPARFGVIWKPKSFVLWSRGATEAFNYLVMRDFGAYHGKGLSRGTAEQMLADAEDGKLSPSFFTALKALAGGNMLNLMSLQGEIVVTYCLALFFNFLLLGITIPMFSFFSSFLYSLSTPNLDVPCRFINLCNLAFYSSFPGMLIAALAYGFQLELLDFRTIALMAFICYYTFVLGKLQKREKKEEERGDYYDDDF